MTNPQGRGFAQRFCPQGEAQGEYIWPYYGILTIAREHGYKAKRSR